MPDKAQYTLIVYPTGYTAHQDFMIYPVEKSRQVDIDGYLAELHNGNALAFR